MKKNSLFDDMMLNWSSKTPSKNSYLTRNLVYKEPLTLEMSLYSNYNTTKRKHISIKKSIELCDDRLSNVSKLSVFHSSALVPLRSQDNSSNIYRALLDNVLRKNRTFNDKREDPIFHVEKGKNEFKKKFNEIKTRLSIKKSFSNKENENTHKYTNLKKDLNKNKFLNGPLLKHMYIKENIDEIFPKREKSFFNSLKIKVQEDLLRENPSRI